MVKTVETVFYKRKACLLLVDTVGFISRLPHYMVDAFKSTLEESLSSDLILLLIDMSECAEYESKVFVILTKFDSVTDPEQRKNDIANNLQISNPIAISSKTRYGISKLKTVIGRLVIDYQTITT